MKLSRLLRGAWGRFVVCSLAIILIMVGASFLPGTTVNSQRLPTGRPVVKEELVGQQAAEHLKKRLASHEKLRRHREQTLARLRALGASEENMLVIRVGAPEEPSSSLSGIQWLWNSQALAQQVTAYGDDGELIITPFENDGDSMTAEFNGTYYDYDTSFYTSVDVRLRTDDPSNTIEILNSITSACIESREKSHQDLASLIAPKLYAQSTWYGISCEDDSGLNNRFAIENTEAIKNGFLAVGGAAFGCIGATIGYPACVGGAWAGAYAVSIGWSTGNMLWNCRCRYLSLSCP
jgi:hypothetical protein